MPQRKAADVCTNIVKIVLLKAAPTRKCQMRKKKMKHLNELSSKYYNLTVTYPIAK